jgi:hypothetical protein
VSATTTTGVKLDLSGVTNAVKGSVAVLASTDALLFNTTNIQSTPYYPTIAFGAKVFTNCVNKLFLNGVQQPAGTYTSNNLPLYITGAGAIRVTGTPRGTAVFLF